jgi:hypothetical protein
MPDCANGADFQTTLSFSHLRGVRAIGGRALRAIRAAIASKPHPRRHVVKSPTRRQRRDGPGSGARAEAILPGSVGSIALVARKTSGGAARERRNGGPANGGAARDRRNGGPANGGAARVQRMAARRAWTSAVTSTSSWPRDPGRNSARGRSRREAQRPSRPVESSESDHPARRRTR